MAMKHANTNLIPTWFIRQKMTEYSKKIERSFTLDTSNEYKQGIANRYFALRELVEDWEIELMKGGKNEI